MGTGVAVDEAVFPPRPPSLRGRNGELKALSEALCRSQPLAVALIGAGGTGKTTLAAALAHRVARLPRFAMKAWVRIGDWDIHTITGMLTLRFGLPREVGLAGVTRWLRDNGPALVVLDNHEKDDVTARLLDGLRDAGASWIITARRCLVAGVAIYPMTSPLAAARQAAFPRVALLNEILRWHPVALDMADAAVCGKRTTARALRNELLLRGIDRIRALDHEDDIPEVGLLVGWLWEQLTKPARRMLAVAAHMGGDHIASEDWARLARVSAEDAAPLDELVRARLVQQPWPGRYALHATVRHAVAKRTRFDSRRFFTHFVGLLERSPQRFHLEQTHLFAAMDDAHERGDLQDILRVDALLSRLEDR